MPSRPDIECPGDVISFNCSVVTNSENPQLAWQGTLPNNEISDGITFNSSSAPGPIDLGFARITLTEVMNLSTLVVSIESTFELILLSDIPLNQTLLQCYSENLDNASLYVNVNSSGNVLDPS